jgi:ribose transport system permease protein
LVRVDIMGRARPVDPATAAEGDDSATTGTPNAGTPNAGTGTGTPGRSWATSNYVMIVLIVDVVLVAVSQFGLGTNLLGRGSLSTLTPVLGVLVLMSLAQGVVVGTGGIDLSIPATVTLVGAVVVKESGGTGGGLVRAVFVALAACVAIGLVNGALVEVLGLNALVVTLATGQLVSGITRLYRGPVPSHSNVPRELSTFAARNVGGVSLILIIAVLLVAVLSIVLNLTVTGRGIVASSASRRAAILAGLAAGRYRIGAWVLATALCGLGAVLLSGQVTNPDLTLGDPYLLSTVVVVVLGGAVLTGGRVSPAGVALGAVFVAVLNQDLQVRGYSSGAAQIAQGIVLGLGLALLGWLRGRRTGWPLPRPRRWAPTT